MEQIFFVKDKQSNRRGVGENEKIAIVEALHITEGWKKNFWV